MNAEHDPEAIAGALTWCEGAGSPSGRRALDVRPGSRTLLSASADPDAARRVLEPSDAHILATGLPANPARIAIDWAFDEDQLGRIRAGFAPSAMEDKWRIVASNEGRMLKVYLRRSWTDDLYYVVEIVGGRAQGLWHQRDAFMPERTAHAIVGGYLLGETCVIPAPAAIADDELQLMSYGIAVAGRRCDFVEPAGSDVASAAASALTRDDRRRGAMLGLAVGDALGAAVEFKPRGSFAPVTGFRGGGPHGLAPGEWTDDTSMALALADSLADCGFDLADQARRYIAWWKEGKYSITGHCFDIGNATHEALARIRTGTAPGSGGDVADHKSGNGSIMRLAPIPIHYLDLFPSEIGRLASLAAESSAPTHRSPKCLSACSYLAVVLAGLMSGCDRDEVLASDWPILEELHRQAPLHPAILEVVRGSYRTKPPSEIRGSGYVVASLEAALWAFHQAPSFNHAVLAAVNLGDDADTTGAICGQLAGAYFGAPGIPTEWLDGLARRDWIEQAVERLGMPGADMPNGEDSATS